MGVEENVHVQQANATQEWPIIFKEEHDSGPSL